MRVAACAMAVVMGLASVTSVADDLFPAKVSITHAVGFSVDYHDTYKVVTVKDPWPGSARAFRYVLTQRGSPRPAVDDAVIIDVPVESVVAMSTTFIGHLAVLDALDLLVGVPEFGHVSNPDVRERIGRGDVAAIGRGGGINIERLLELKPDLFLAYILEGTHLDAHRLLRQAGIGIALGGGYVESTPLGRCEWLKFTALFLNAEARAEAYFADVVASYEQLRALAAGAADRPSVLVNAPYKDVWHLPGGSSYMARYIQDAGANYLWGDDTHTGGIPVGFEAIYARAGDADFWINPGAWRTLEEALEKDTRFRLFRAFREGRVYNHNRRMNGQGGDDFWESGSVKPHLVLKDLVAIFHPGLLPEYAMHWYQRLE